MSPSATERASVSFVCNGRNVTVETRPDRLLLDVLREDMDLTGAKLGCGTGDCGACAVLLDGDAVNACLVYAIECEGRSVETPEHVAETDVGRVVVEKLVASGGVQCGICTPGFVVSATSALTGRRVKPSRDEIQVALAGNICRCTGYVPIIEAVLAAADCLEATEEETDG